jgi:hypothetical protein
MASLQSGGSGSVSKSESQYICGVGKETDEEEGSLDAPPAVKKVKSRLCMYLYTVYFLAHFCPVAFFRQMIELKITLKKTHF